MYQPSFNIKPNGIPYVTKKQLSKIGDNFVRDFQPRAYREWMPIDIEFFLEFYLGLKLEFQYLSHNGIYLGMTVFNDTDKVIIFCPETNRAEYISAKARTVIIDNRLLEKNQEHRLRFTLAYECSHDILHSGYFSTILTGSPIIPGMEIEPMIQCRIDSYRQNDSNEKTDEEWMEWQADALASAILMPESLVYKLSADCQNNYGGKGRITTDQLVREVSRTFNVSKESAKIRLCELGIIKKSTVPYAENNPAIYNGKIRLAT